MLQEIPLLAVHSLRDRKSLRGLSFYVRPGQLVCLLSEEERELSRAVKTIAGWESPAEGDVFFKGRKITNSWLGRKKLYYVSRKARPALASGRDGALLEEMGLGQVSLSFEHRDTILSIARALAFEPELLVIDRRADDLPARLRASVFNALTEAAEAGMGILYAGSVKDDCPQSSQVYLMAQGRIIQSGAFLDVYEQPVSLTAAIMTGDCLLLPGQVDAMKGDKLLFSSEGLSIPCRSVLWHTPGEYLVLCLRPEWLQWNKEGDKAFSPPLKARLLKAEPAPGGHRLSFELPNGRLFELERAGLPSALRKPGESYQLCWDMNKALLLQAEHEDIPTP